MVLQTLSKVWKNWSLGKALQGGESRQLQLEIDTHRLYLITSFHAAGPEASQAAAAALEQRATAMPFEEQQRAVQGHVHRQLLGLLRSLQEILQPRAASFTEPAGGLQAADGGGSREADPRAQGSLADGAPPASPHRRKRPSGLSFAVGGLSQAEGGAQKEIAGRRDEGGVSMAEAAAQLRAHAGFALELGPSEVGHAEAGQGLFVRGRAPLGAVLALYPGVVYLPSQYKSMPGYPRVDRNNPYLISRFDGAVIDGRPWGRGGSGLEWWSGLEARDLDWFLAKGSSGGAAPMWEAVLGGGNEVAAALLARSARLVERRNPLALAHFANHPGPGSQPNVMLCAYDFRESAESASLRPYIPNTPFGGGGDTSFQRQGVFWVDGRRVDGDGARREQRSGEGEAVVRSLLLVATRDVCDEEVLLSYRLSSPLGRPAWYTPVDAEEDRRRWA